jgi:hypothetical protein
VYGGPPVQFSRFSFVFSHVDLFSFFVAHAVQFSFFVFLVLIFDFRWSCSLIFGLHPFFCSCVLSSCVRIFDLHTMSGGCGAIKRMRGRRPAACAYRANEFPFQKKHFPFYILTNSISGRFYHKIRFRE